MYLQIYKFHEFTSNNKFVYKSCENKFVFLQWNAFLEHFFPLIIWVYFYNLEYRKINS